MKNFGNTPDKRKKVELTIYKKQEILKELLNNEITREYIMITYNVSRSTISTWIKDKNHILNYTGPETQQRDQPIKHVELENKLYDWYRGAIALYLLPKFQ